MQPTTPLTSQLNEIVTQLHYGKSVQPLTDHFKPEDLRLLF